MTHDTFNMRQNNLIEKKFHFLQGRYELKVPLDALERKEGNLIHTKKQCETEKVLLWSHSRSGGGSKGERTAKKK